jgi:hypothetical protein
MRILFLSFLFPPLLIALPSFPRFQKERGEGGQKYNRHDVRDDGGVERGDARENFCACLIFSTLGVKLQRRFFTLCGMGRRGGRVKKR